MMSKPLSLDPTHLMPIRKDTGFHLPDYWVWCGSVIRDDAGLYHMFASRWPRTLPFHPGWLTNSQIVRATSQTPEGPYTFAEVVFEPRGPSYWDGDSTHNPHIVRAGGKYVLFYMGTRTPLPNVAPDESLSMRDPRVIVARSNKRIGVATADHPAGPWKRMDAPVLLPKPGTFYDFFTSNPAPLIEDDGSVILVFKSRRYKPDRTHSDMMLGVARAPRVEGPYEVITPDPIFGGHGKPALEDPFIWRSERGIELIAKDMTGAYSGQPGAGMRAISSDGIQWKLDDPPHSWDRTFSGEDGSSVTVGSAERPFILFENGRPTHLLLSMSDGPGDFKDITKTWVQPIAFREGLEPRPGAVIPTRHDRPAGPRDAAQSPPRKVIVASTMHTFSGPLARRVTEMEGLVDQALAQARAAYQGRGIDLIVFPEHAFQHPGQSPADRAIPLDDPAIQTIAAKARAVSCNIVVPLILREADQRFTNAAVVLDRKGGLVGIYRKAFPVINAQGKLEGGISPGDSFPVFACDFGRIGVQICWDMCYDDGWNELARRGCELVVLPSMSPQCIRPSAYAQRGRYYVISSTPRDNASLFDPIGERIATIEKPGILLAEIDLAYAVLHWSDRLDNGRLLTDRFGAKAAYRYSTREDTGVFWSNDPGKSIGQMIRELDLRQMDEYVSASREAREKALFRPSTALPTP